MTSDEVRRFDCVRTMRAIRDQISAEITEMSFAELSHWLDTHRCADPALQRLAERLGQRNP